MNKIILMLKFYLLDIGVLVHLGLVSIAIWVAVTTGGWLMLVTFIIGWITYVFQEHLVHRFIFHASAPNNQFLFNMLYRLHYGHHDQIQNLYLLFTPLWFSLGLGVVNFAVMALILPLPYAFVIVYGGGVSSYLLFEWMHLLSHFNTRKRGSSITVRVTRRHAQHHYIDFNKWFTVSLGGNFVDSILGANPTNRIKVPNTRTCGLDDNDPRLVKARKCFVQDTTLAMTNL